jgi:hypothetical protein
VENLSWQWCWPAAQRHPASEIDRNSHRQVGFRVGPKLKLSTLPSRVRINSHPGQPMQMVAMLTRIHHVGSFVTTLEPVLDERMQHPILFLVIVEKSTDAPQLAELGAGKRNWRRELPNDGDLLCKFPRMRLLG